MSRPWQEDLRKLTAEVSKISKHWLRGEAAFYKMERALFMGAFIIRKLVQSPTVSPTIKNMQVDVTVFKRRKNHKVPKDNFDTFKDRHDFSQFRMSKPIGEKLPIEEFTNLFIHSYVFVPFNDCGVTSIEVNSDYEHKRRLYRITFAEITRVFLEVVQDDLKTWPVVLDSTPISEEDFEKQLAIGRKKLATGKALGWSP